MYAHTHTANATWITSYQEALNTWIHRWSGELIVELITDPTKIKVLWQLPISGELGVLVSFRGSRRRSSPQCCIAWYVTASIPGLLLVRKQFGGWRGQCHIIHRGCGFCSGHAGGGERAMPGDGLPLQCPVEVGQESRLDAKAGFGRGGHLRHNCGHCWLLRDLGLSEAGAIISFGSRGRRGLLHGRFGPGLWLRINNCHFGRGASREYCWNLYGGQRKLYLRWRGWKVRIGWRRRKFYHGVLSTPTQWNRRFCWHTPVLENSGKVNSGKI